jgi:hypothetical protein
MVEKVSALFRSMSEFGDNAFKRSGTSQLAAITCPSSRLHSQVEKSFARLNWSMSGLGLKSIIQISNSLGLIGSS